MKSTVMIFLAVVFLFPMAVLANDDGDTQVFVSLHKWSTVLSEGNSKSVRLGSDILRGVGIGIPLNDTFTVNSEFLFGDPATTVTPGTNNTAEMMMFNLSLDTKIRRADWHNGDISPFINVGLGAMEFNQETTNGIDEWDMSYSLGAGINWDMGGGNTFLKFYYRWFWVDMDVTNSMELFDGVSFAFGMAF